MTERDLRCPGCSSFNKKMSSSCMFKNFETLSDKKDNVICTDCNREISEDYISSNKDSSGNIVCPDCGKVIKV